MGRKKNTEALLQILILIVMACLLLYAMLSKKINYYVHPRFNIGVWCSIIILILFAVSLLSKVKKARHNVNTRHYFIFIIPIAAALIFPVSGANPNKDMTLTLKNPISGNLSEGTNSNDTANTIVNSNTSNSTDMSNTDTSDTNTSDNDKSDIDSSVTDPDSSVTDLDTSVTDPETSATDLNSSVTDMEDISKKYVDYEVNGVMVITDDIFADWYFDMYNNLGSFQGKQCQFLAQVYSMEEFDENQFLAGRYFMICCAADLVGYGIACESDIRSQLKDDEWIMVKGSISEFDYNGQMVPLLTDVTITKAEPPETEYIYYNN